jgi:hypothetical protein
MTPPELPPLLRDQRKIDAQHLKLLTVFHYVLAGLSLVGLGFLCLHWAFMHVVMSMPQKSGNPPPQQVFMIFRLFYAFFGVFIVGGGALTLASGICIARRKARVFSLVVAGINCLMFPFGTTLGVFTIIVLIRDSVVELYEGNRN